MQELIVKDRGMLSISGMDASVPQVVRNFIQPEAQQ